MPRVLRAALHHEREEEDHGGDLRPAEGVRGEGLRDGPLRAAQHVPEEKYHRKTGHGEQEARREEVHGWLPDPLVSEGVAQQPPMAFLESTLETEDARSCYTGHDHIPMKPCDTMYDTHTHNPALHSPNPTAQNETRKASARRPARMRRRPRRGCSPPPC